MKEEAEEYANIYPQHYYHTKARIIATKDGLVAIRDAIDEAIARGVATADVYASDGEGYQVEIKCVLDPDKMDEPFYTLERLERRDDR